MARRKNGVALPVEAREPLRRMLLEAGVSATAIALKAGREHVLAGAGDLPLLPPAVASFLADQLCGSNRAA